MASSGAGGFNFGMPHDMAFEPPSALQFSLMQEEASSSSREGGDADAASKFAYLYKVKGTGKSSQEVRRQEMLDQQKQ